MYPEDSGSGWALDSRNRWATVFFPGDLAEIEAEPEKVERPGSRSPGKEAGKGLGDPSQGGKPSTGGEGQECGMGMAVGARGQPELQEAPGATIRLLSSPTGCQPSMSAVGHGTIKLRLAGAKP